MQEKRVLFDDSGNPSEIRYYEDDILVARLGIILSPDSNFIGLRELNPIDVMPLSWADRFKQIFGSKPKRVDITTIDFIGLINWINTIKTIKKIEEIVVVDEITKIKSIEEVVNVSMAEYGDIIPKDDGVYVIGDSAKWFKEALAHLFKIKDIDLTPINDIMLKCVDGVLLVRDINDTVYCLIKLDCIPDLPTSKITSGTFGSAYLDLSALAQNIVFVGAQTVDGVDISALLLKTTKATDLASIWDKTTKIAYGDTDFADQPVKTTSKPQLAGIGFGVVWVSGLIYFSHNNIVLTGLNNAGTSNRELVSWGVAGTDILRIGQEATSIVIGGAAIPTTFGGSIIAPYMSRVRAYLNSAQQIDNNTFTKVLLNGETYDALNEFANYKFTATVAGYYHVIGQVGISKNGYALNQFIAEIRVNNAYVTRSQQADASTLNDDISNLVTDIIYLNVGDYVELWAYQSAGLSKNLKVSSAMTYLTLERIP